MTLDVEGVEDGGMCGQESLGGTSRFEALHSSLPKPDRQVRVLRPIVAASAGDVSTFHAEIAQRSAIGRQFIGYDSLRREDLFLEQLAQEFQRGGPVAARRNQDIQNFTFAVDRTPQICALSVDRDKDLVQVPPGGGSWTRTSESPRISQAEFQRPAPNAFVGHVDAALGEKILDIPEAQRKPKIQPDSVLNDFRWEAMLAICGGVQRRLITREAIIVGLP